MSLADSIVSGEEDQGRESLLQQQWFTEGQWFTNSQCSKKIAGYKDYELTLRTTYLIWK